MSETSAPKVVTVTLDLTDDDVYAVLVSALREAAAEAADNAQRAGEEGEEGEANTVYAEDQEQVAQIALDLVQSIETQIDTAYLATTTEAGA
jgi:hypothetical protein